MTRALSTTPLSINVHARALDGLAEIVIKTVPLHGAAQALDAFELRR